jgi:hypothetical protein
MLVLHDLHWFRVIDTQRAVLLGLEVSPCPLRYSA